MAERRWTSRRAVVWLACGAALGCTDTTSSGERYLYLGVTPNEPIALVGDTMRLRARATDAGGATVADPQVVWSSGDHGRATVDQTGLVTGVAAGTAEFTAAAGDLLYEFPLRVLAATSVGPEGGTLTSADGVARLVLPSGALAALRPVGLTTPANQSTFPRVYALPEGLTLLDPGTLTVRYDPTQVPAGWPAADLVLLKVDGEHWTLLSHNVVDSVAHTVSAQVTGLGTYEVTLPVIPSTWPREAFLVVTNATGNGKELWTLLPAPLVFEAVPLPEDLRTRSVRDQAWAPGHARLAFTAPPPSNDLSRDLYAVGINGQGLVNLSNTPTLNEYGPTWSPDGTRLAFLREGAIWVVPATGGPAEQVAVAGTVQGIDWSPDGARFVAQVDYNLVTLPVAGGPATTVYAATTRGNALRPRWSPDGTHVLAFMTGSVDAAGGLVTMRADGSDLRLVAEGLFNAHAWSPAGDQIAVTNRQHVIIGLDLNGTEIWSTTTTTDGLAWR